VFAERDKQHLILRHLQPHTESETGDPGPIP